MEIQKSTGIVLSSRTSGEADLFCRILTKECGKRDFIIKGLKKSKRRSQSAAEPGTVLKLIYYFSETRSSFIVKEFEVLRYNFDIRDNLQKIFNLYLILETVEKTSGYNDTDRQIFDLLAAGIDTVSKTDSPVNLSVFFILHLLRLQGLLPDMKKCKKCGRTDYREFTLDISDLCPLCENCSGSRMKLTQASARNFIEDSLTQKFMHLNNPDFNRDNALNLIFYLVMFIEHYFNIEIKSKKNVLSSDV